MSARNNLASSARDADDGADPLSPAASDVINIASRTAPEPEPASTPTPTTTTTTVAAPRQTGHLRALSHFADPAAVVRPGRFSLQFPVQPATTTAAAAFRIARAATSPDCEPVSSQSEPNPDASDTTATPSSFLTAIAAQERRVLELREELQRAEADLDRLKSQWVQHEAKKKRQDARRLTRLQPLHTGRAFLPTATAAPDDDCDGSNAWMQQEMERRKALLAHARTSSRTVFSGSRHTRALSLLTTAKDAGSLPSPVSAARLPPRLDSLPPASLAIEHLSGHHHEVGRDPRDPIRALADTAAMDHELLLRTGRKMAADLKDGLWTFWEDLRQATVGEESTQDLPPPPPPPPPRRKPSSQTLKSAKKRSKSALRQSSRDSPPSARSSPSPARLPCSHPPAAALPDLTDPAFWIDPNLAFSSPAPIKKPGVHAPSRSHAHSVHSTSSTDAWDPWPDHTTAASSSPGPTHSSASSVDSGPRSPAEERGSLLVDLRSGPEVKGPRRSAREGVQTQPPIPWPTLTALVDAPGSLRRTASHLMREWERSLTPSPADEVGGGEGGVLGFPAVSVGVGAERKRD